MSVKLVFTGNASATSYSSTPFSLGLDWLSKLSVIGLDTETNVTSSILNRQLKVISISNEEGTVVWVIAFEDLSEQEKLVLFQSIKSKLCVIQNVSFDYSIFSKYGVLLEKVYDTMLMEQVLSNGLSSEQGFYGLQAIFQRRFNITISKEEQLTFGDGGPYTDRQIQYAAVDVIKLGLLRKLQLDEARVSDLSLKHKGRKGLRKTSWWENEFVKVVSDMETTGVRIHKDKWYAIENSVRPIFDEELENLNRVVVELYYDCLVDNNWISDKDELTGSIWGSAAKKKLVLDHVYDFKVEKTTKVDLKKYLEEHDPDYPKGLKPTGKAWDTSSYPVQFDSKFAILKLLILNGTNTPEITEALNTFLLTNLRDFCIENQWIREANKVSINWGSPAQRLKIFQVINPSIQSTSKEILVDYEENILIQHYLAWAEVEYQLKNFGKPFYDNHVEIDGKHRTRYNQILATGRLSSVKPNLLNIPRKHEEYRAAFIPDPGFELIDADFDGQELIITTILSQEPSWLYYMKMGYDMHSRNADLIFGDRWAQATEENCTYYEVDPTSGLSTPKYKKCKCKGHQDMRDKSKAVSFGSIYGISYIKLAVNLKISEEEAKFILTKFFEIAPGISSMMQRFGRFGLSKGLIVEPVFGRVRFFDPWKLNVPSEHGAIERASFNTPIKNVWVKNPVNCWKTSKKRQSAAELVSNS
jgi:DNA polymerase I-like protein with 3'-5' exonuclease and polymerase domains